jgi:hypothetical protein
MGVQIKKPCKQGWNTMSPANDGRHCKACDKVVVDFTNMNEEEIKNYFRKNCDQKICGHFSASQLDLSNHFLVGKLLKWQTKLMNFGHKNIWTKVAASFIGLLLLMSGCESHKEGSSILTGDTIAVPQSQILKDSTTLNGNKY